VQSIVLVALKDPAPAVFTDGNPVLDGYLAHLRREPVPADVPVLTDEYAPVERYMEGLYRVTP